MPDCCCNCPCLDGEYGKCNISRKSIRSDKGRLADCPLVELPDHGDLIEKRPIVDALAVAEKNVSFLQRGVEREENIKWCQGAMVGYANSILAIDNAPVVIHAERSEEEYEDENENWYTELDDPKIAERSKDGET